MRHKLQAEATRILVQAEMISENCSQDLQLLFRLFLNVSTFQALFLFLLGHRTDAEMMGKRWPAMLKRCGTLCFEKGGFRDLCSPLLLLLHVTPTEVGQSLSNKVNNLLHSRMSLLVYSYTTEPLRSQAALLYNPGGINL